MRTGTVYVGFEPSGANGLRIAFVKQRKPKYPDRPTVKLSISLPDAIFEPTVVDVTVPEQAVAPPVVVVIEPDDDLAD